MAQVDPKMQKKQASFPSTLPHTYAEVVNYLDSHWQPTTNLTAITQLDKSFGSLAHTLKTVLISGTNGKSITAHFTSKLLQEEGLKVGIFYTPHITLYNERFCLDNEYISNQEFTKLANKVIARVESEKIAASTKDILVMMAVLFFHENNIDIAIFENSSVYDIDPVFYMQPIVSAITRLVAKTANEDFHHAITNIMQNINTKTHVVSADQNKFNLHLMHQIAETKGSHWSMPIRKLAPLAYPFEQLHGRCAALAERISSIFAENFLNQHTIAITESLLSRPKGQRGRPTLEAKRKSELHPKRTIEQFWSETTTTLPFHFQLLKKEKPAVLLDTADNLDAFTNLFLGIRLLHYKHPFKGLALILGCQDNQFEDEEFIKQIRYFFKKTSGVVAFYPTATKIGEKAGTAWDAQKITNAAKNAKIKAKYYPTFKEAFEASKKLVDDRDGLLVLAGSKAIIEDYLHYKDTKKA